MAELLTLEAAICDAIAVAPTTGAAMREVVTRLAAGMKDYTWVGIYLLEGDTLVLGPFVGKPSPHVRIPLNQGICGAAASQRATLIVDDVNRDPRYRACSLETRSEIVVPIMRGDRVLGEIDIDSDRVAAFGPPDRQLVEAVAAALAERLADQPSASGPPPSGRSS